MFSSAFYLPGYITDFLFHVLLNTTLFKEKWFGKTKKKENCRVLRIRTLKNNSHFHSRSYINLQARAIE